MHDGGDNFGNADPITTEAATFVTPELASDTRGNGGERNGLAFA